jgi:hypothetical protein
MGKRLRYTQAVQEIVRLPGGNLLIPSSIRGTMAAGTTNIGRKSSMERLTLD